MKTILVIEDSRFLRLTTERTLAREGYKVVSSCDGDEVLRLAPEATVDLILLDLLLPKLSGPDVLQSLRATPQTATVPIGSLSGLPQSKERKLKRDGATANFDKSSLALHEHPDSLLLIVKQMPAEAKEGAASIELPAPEYSVMSAKGDV